MSVQKRWCLSAARQVHKSQTALLPHRADRDHGAPDVCANRDAGAQLHAERNQEHVGDDVVKPCRMPLIEVKCKCWLGICASAFPGGIGN